MKILETDRNSTEQILAALRPASTGPDTEVAKIVTEIIADVRKRGDEALLELGRKFDSPELKDLKASEEEFEQAYSDIEPKLLDAIRTAKSNIDQYHRK